MISPGRLRSNSLTWDLRPQRSLASSGTGHREKACVTSSTQENRFKEKRKRLKREEGMSKRKNYNNEQCY
jgi:hypothetical protein